MKPQDAKWCQTAVFAFSAFKFVCHVSKAKVERTESLCPKGLPESVLDKLKKEDVCTFGEDSIGNFNLDAMWTQSHSYPIKILTRSTTSASNAWWSSSSFSERAAWRFIKHVNSLSAKEAGRKSSSAGWMVQLLFSFPQRISMLNLDLKRASGKCFSPCEDWPKGYARKGLAEFFLKKSGSQMKSWKGFPILASNLFLGVKSSMTCPSWRKSGSAGMMRQLRLTRKAWSWHHRTQIQKKDRKG